MSSNLPISSPYRSTPDAPVTDAERDRLNARLNAAYTAGGLDQDDYRARLDLLFAAKRLGELVPVVEGLPPLPTHSSPAIVTSSDWAARRTGGVTCIGTIERRCRGRSGCRSPPHCHPARAPDLGTTTSSVRSQTDCSAQSRDDATWRAPNTSAERLRIPVKVAHNDLVWLT